MVQKKVLVAMSGGVDSSVAVRLLQDKGYQVAGATMKLLDGEAEELRIEKTRRVAKQLGIELYVFPAEEAFKKGVIEYFADEYINGRTPNPCIMCNQLFKFGLFLEKAEELGFDAIATGHYAKIIRDEKGIYRLLQSENVEKDQSYFLYGMTQRILSKVIFPLEDGDKEQVRRIAAEMGLENAGQKDSQDICFVKDCLYTDIIDKICEERGTQRRKGNFVDVDGNVLAQHSGIERYTIGQRKGVGVSLGAGKPLYVIEKRAGTAEVVMGDDSLLFKKELRVEDVSLVSGDCPEDDNAMQVEVKTRFNQKGLKAEIEYEPETRRARIIFEKPVRAVTPGQFAVFYRGNEVLGGGKILNS
ncbi:MAG: tRNA 2-thiouridine(34) synthase MnmA [Clostridia bacterium]|nr:tRNA 2-thiouridine(34) synthase MnmA [Clostridia bacterium]